MSFKISETLTSLKDQINKEPMIVLEIENSKYLYGTAPILVKARWDDPRIKWDNEEGVTWDGFIEKDNSKPYIMTKGSKTTKSFSSQLIVEKGGAGSIPPMEIELVDYRGEVAEDLSFNSIGEFGQTVIIRAVPGRDYNSYRQLSNYYPCPHFGTFIRFSRYFHFIYKNR